MKRKPSWRVLFSVEEMKVFLSRFLRKIGKSHGNVANLKKKGNNLRLTNPSEVLRALAGNQEISEWLRFISNHYDPPHKRVLLIYPCTSTKPYSNSRSYKALFKTLSSLNRAREKVHLMTISEPFGLVPEEFQDEDSWGYDCPGLFEWWCNRNDQTYSKEKLDKCIEMLAKYTAEFFKKAKRRKCYSKIVAFVRTYTSNLERKYDHTHRRIIERAAEIAGVEVDILPPKSLVAKIVKERGRFAWDMYGVAHPIAQEYLLKQLRRSLNDN